MIPFRGLDLSRPYPSTGLTTARWMAEVPTEMVMFSRLYLTQDKLSIPGLLGYNTYSVDIYPHVVRWQDTLYLEDGHHRVLRAALRNALGMPMRVFKDHHF